MTEHVKPKFLGDLTIAAMERADLDLSKLLELHKTRMSFDLLGDDAILRTHQVAEVLGLQRRTLENWRRAGEGPKWFQLAGRPVMLLGELRGWIRDEIGGQAKASK